MDFDSSDDEALVDISSVDILMEDVPSSMISSCPECGTTKLMVPNLQIKFANCCGRAMCVPCITSRFKHAPMWFCDKCEKSMKIEGWDELPLEQQRFKAEVKYRNEGTKSHVLCLESCDFPTVRLYDDYLEWSSEQIYQQTYGTKEAQIIARNEITKFSIREKEKIERSRRRQRANQLENNNNNNSNDNTSTATWQAALQSSNQSTPLLSFPMPTIIEKTNLISSSYISADEQIKLISDPTLRYREQMALNQLRRIAGGCKREEEAKRLKQETLDGLGWG